MVNEANSTIGGGNVVPLGVTTGPEALLQRLTELQTSITARRDDAPTPPPETLSRWTDTLIGFAREANALGAFGRPSEYERMVNGLTQLKSSSNGTPDAYLDSLATATGTLQGLATKLSQQRSQQQQL